MSNLIRRDPFDIDSMPDLFQGFFRPLREFAQLDDNPLASVRVDVSENDTAFTVKAELPGFKKENIDVQLDGNVVAIRAKVERDEEQKEGERVVRRERYSGEVSRSFSLSAEVDETQAEAKYEDGVLSLTLPKKASAERKKLTVN